jgi:hypothetical protein
MSRHRQDGVPARTRWLGLGGRVGLEERLDPAP